MPLLPKKQLNSKLPKLRRPVLLLKPPLLPPRHWSILLSPTWKLRLLLTRLQIKLPWLRLRLRPLKLQLSVRDLLLRLVQPMRLNTKLKWLLAVPKIWLCKRSTSKRWLIRRLLSRKSSVMCGVLAKLRLPRLL